ncbi:hypothetical protein LEP1GSC036_4160 [Leptospira weilii str. 2006001853]|uniref:Uncharacterized protein n=3 Tax=Leptospira weilii TaxID=28184 RepID=A0A828YYL1_9LEPT|nr:hypothetical protein LEP1GSC036_4160 [Leptospira weilii str. 2006001853]EMM72206.1 hypothetical protein LEP1GSC038_3709 [Leptospira weilii str. 2006001855]EMN90118.1 hypothetical protein LEP1GSC108_4766 [Leptospira weilii str. UI 13098]
MGSVNYYVLQANRERAESRKTKEMKELKKGNTPPQEKCRELFV